MPLTGSLVTLRSYAGAVNLAFAPFVYRDNPIGIIHDADECRDETLVQLHGGHVVRVPCPLDGWLIYAGRAGTGITQAELERLWRRLQPLSISHMPLAVPPPRDSRFGSPLVLSRVHWVRPELVAEVKYLTWTCDNLLRQVVYEGLREDKPAAEVRREAPHPKPVAATTLAVNSSKRRRR
jgi:ATP-dependent DNA ligase